MSLSEYCLSGAIGTLNNGGSVLRQLGVDVPSLQRHALEHAARRRARLDDFGAWPIDEPLERLLESYERDARLTTLGRITAREMLVGLLENLLHMEAERKRDPGVEQEVVEAPVFIISLPRTGTTFLHNLMAEDRATRVPLTWEVTYPTEHENDVHGIAEARRRTASRMNWANRLIPDFKRIHAIDEDLPQECLAITAPVFMSIQFHTTHNVATYQDWFERSSHGLGFAFHERMLQHLQRQRPPKRWLLKAPGHLFGAESLFERYPDAKVIQTHRDPIRAMASMASHATVLRRAFSDEVDPHAVAADWAERWMGALERFMRFRDAHLDGRVLDVDYRDVEREPLETVARIYEFLGWPLDGDAERALRAYVDANPKHKHGKHRYRLADYGLDGRAMAERFAPYCERFDLPMEAG